MLKGEGAMQESFEQFNVAFIRCGEVGAEKELRGAILVTDKKSHPIELRYTEAVKASAQVWLFA